MGEPRVCRETLSGHVPPPPYFIVWGAVPLRRKATLNPRPDVRRKRGSSWTNSLRIRDCGNPLKWICCQLKRRRKSVQSVYKKWIFNSLYSYQPVASSPLSLVDHQDSRGPRSKGSSVLISRPKTIEWKRGHGCCVLHPTPRIKTHT